MQEAAQLHEKCQHGRLSLEADLQHHARPANDGHEVASLVAFPAGSVTRPPGLGWKDERRGRQWKQVRDVSRPAPSSEVIERYYWCNSLPSFHYCTKPKAYPGFQPIEVSNPLAAKKMGRAITGAEAVAIAILGSQICIRDWLQRCCSWQVQMGDDALSPHIIRGRPKFCQGLARSGMPVPDAVFHPLECTQRSLLRLPSPQV
ncbi:hypothetical protein ASPTUDRAFT_50176 [Aspergillus tubingensis CBS 134.48]|uniref:Uncharacterized protein n=1 Tax=Aspergillus tubingensis (strain CBS 134.48) TaxID=767770 RepID=A0A1L9NJ06_ASPTC|nr:hypothetical protein ASPTUDRAFT_50176 [Aspergillus tubingensis CBS 134.48]